MQHEFNDRIAAQRAILRVVNSRPWRCEQLFGLSSKAIDRWVSINRIEPSTQLVKLVKDTSAKLSFLANKSQEQISDDYRTVSGEIAALRQAIQVEIEIGARISDPV